MSLYVDVSHVSVYQCNVMQRILTMSYVIMYACMSKQHASLWGATRQEKNSNYSRVLQFGDRDGSSISNPRPEFDGSLHPVCPEIFCTRLIFRQGPTSPSSLWGSWALPRNSGRQKVAKTSPALGQGPPPAKCGSLLQIMIKILLSVYLRVHACICVCLSMCRSIYPSNLISSHLI